MRAKPFLKQALVFTCLQIKSFENTEGKEEIARNEQFLLFPQCFLSFQRTFRHFHQIKNCRLQTLSVWKSLKFVVWKRVNASEQADTSRTFRPWLFINFLRVVGHYFSSTFNRLLDEFGLCCFRDRVVESRPTKP